MSDLPWGLTKLWVWSTLKEKAAEKPKPSHSLPQGLSSGNVSQVVHQYFSLLLTNGRVTGRKATKKEAFILVTVTAVSPGWWFLAGNSRPPNPPPVSAVDNTLVHKIGLRNNNNLCYRFNSNLCLSFLIQETKISGLGLQPKGVPINSTHNSHSETIQPTNCTTAQRHWQQRLPQLWVLREGYLFSNRP